MNIDGAEHLLDQRRRCGDWLAADGGAEEQEIKIACVKLGLRQRSTRGFGAHVFLCLIATDDVPLAHAAILFEPAGTKSELRVELPRRDDLAREIDAESANDGFGVPHVRLWVFDDHDGSRLPDFRIKAYLPRACRFVSVMVAFVFLMK
jgi:hypothetical protein